MVVTVRVRSLVWYVTGALVASVVVCSGLSAWSVEAAPGDEDATFVPVAPCRVLDQRDSGVPTGPVETVTQQIIGSNGDCTIPSDAVAVSMNVTIARPTAHSFLTVFPADLSAPPLASNLNWTATSSPTPNKVDVQLSPQGAIKFYNEAGQVFVIADIVGYYTSSSLQELSARLAELEALTASMSLATVDGQPTVRFTGVNVQVVDGSGTTSGTNGRGNLIVGYNENQTDQRTGSHNLVIGASHSYSGAGGLVAGHDNTISGHGATVTGGSRNTASGTRSSVSGGYRNTASGASASVSGGSNNIASGGESSVTGGLQNVANGNFETVVGGDGIPFCIDDSTALEAKVCGEGTISPAD